MATNAYTPVPMTSQQGVTFCSPPSNPQRKRERKTYKRTLYWFGYVEIILGIFSCLITVVSLSITHGFYAGASIQVSSGIWCGLFLLFTGILAASVKRTESVSRINANMAMAIVTSILMAIMFLFSILIAVRTGGFVSVLYVLLSIIASAGLILCIVHAAFCCATTCCIQRPTGGVIYTPVQHPVQFVPLANGQYMMVPNQPLMGQNYPGTVPPVYPGAQGLSGTPVTLPQYSEQKETQQTAPPPPYSSQNEEGGAPGTSGASQ